MLTTPPFHLYITLGRWKGREQKQQRKCQTSIFATCPLHGTNYKIHYYKISKIKISCTEATTWQVNLTSVTSREAAAALICKLGCLIELRINKYSDSVLSQENDENIYKAAK